MNESIATDLYERAKWKRTTTVEDVWIGTALSLFLVCRHCSFFLHSICVLPPVTTSHCPCSSLCSCFSCCRTSRLRMPIHFSPPGVRCICRMLPASSWTATLSACTDASAFFYSRRAFNTAAEVRAANDEFKAHAHLADHLATFFRPCHSTHDPVWAGDRISVT